MGAWRTGLLDSLMGWNSPRLQWKEADQAKAAKRALRGRGTAVSTAVRGSRRRSPDPVGKETSYGLGRSGSISVTLDERLDALSWREIEEWVRTSYALVAPNALGVRVIEGGDAVRADSAESERSARGTMSRFPVGTPARRLRRASDISRRPR
jgi:hypothetical protein